MSEPIPIACTLTTAGLRDRGVAWRKLLGSGLVDRSRVPGGVRLTPRQGAQAALLELVELERACCGWMRIEIGEEAAVTLTSERAEGQAVLALLFLRLPSLRRVVALAGVGLAALACAAACALPFALLAAVAARAWAALLPAAVAALAAGAAGAWMWRRMRPRSMVVPAGPAVKG